MKRAALLALALATAARADQEVPPRKRVQLPSGIVVEARGAQVLIGRGATRVAMDVDWSRHAAGALVTSVEARDDGHQVRVKATRCDEDPGDATITHARLEARLANAGALALHHEKRYAEAAAGFARARALDPTYAIAAYNLASALLLDGKRADALAALAPEIARDPVDAYAHVLFDDELRPLADAEPLRALRSPAPGATDLYPAKRGVRFAYSPARRMLAHLEGALVIYAADGREVLSRASTEPRDLKCTGTDEFDRECVATRQGRQRIAAREALMARLLADLGFVVPPDLEVAALDGEACRKGGKPIARLPRARLGLVLDCNDGALRLLRGDRVLAAARPAHADGFDWAVAVPSAGALWAATGDGGWSEDGCHDWDWHDATITVLKTAP